MIFSSNLMIKYYSDQAENSFIIEILELSDINYYLNMY